MKYTIVLIPSLDPDEKLENYILQLDELGIKRTNIIVVNDGSRINVDVFDRLRDDGVTVLIHEKNMGKGRALKTGFEYILSTYSSEEVAGVVTADADGQHSAKDTVRVCNELENTGAFVLGTRNFSEKSVPFRSKWGNTITTMVFGVLYGKLVGDTQTGLRGIPFDWLPSCVEMQGERFDYEIVMLIEAAVRNLKIIQLPIDTIYINSNRASHFNAFKDSWKIYRILLRRGIMYALSSMIGAIVDLSVFAALSKLFFERISESAMALLGATVIARMFSNIINYLVNRDKVFKCKDRYVSSAVKYALLAIVQMITSWFFVNILYDHLLRGATLIKAIVDTLLFFVSYQVQQKWVFRE